MLWDSSFFRITLNTDYIQKIDEVRIGYNSRTFDRLLRHKSIEPSDVGVHTIFIRYDRISYIGKMCFFYFLQ